MGEEKIKQISKVFCILIIPLMFFGFFQIKSFGQVIDDVSFFTNNAPEIDGLVMDGEWINSTMIVLDHGYILVKNDQINLYLLLDIVDDVSNETILTNSRWEDYFWVTFDVNLDRNVTVNVDCSYSVIPSELILGRSVFLSSRGSTGLMSTESRVGIGFGSTLNSEIPHRFWELAINLQEISTNAYGQVRVGFRIHSNTPSFTYQIPQDYVHGDYDFSDLIKLDLGVPYEPPNEPEIPTEPEEPETPSEPEEPETPTEPEEPTEPETPTEPEVPTEPEEPETPTEPEEPTEPEQPEQPEIPEQIIENFELGSIEIFSFIAILVIIILIFVTLWTKKSSKDLQSKYNHKKINFIQFKS